MTIDLALGSQRLSLDPALGGALLRWRLGDQDLLRAAPRGAKEPWDTAAFAQVPYAGRTPSGRQAWQVESAGGTFAELVFASPHPGPRYAARQSVRLERAGLVMTLAVTNHDAAPAAFGLGFHPCFPHAATARLTADVAGDALAGTAVRGATAVDRCHTGWKGAARIDLGPDRPSLMMTASEALGCLHVCAAPDEDDFRVEPISHPPHDSHHDEAHAARILAPGETLAAEARLQIL